MPQAVIDHIARDVYEGPGIKLARLEHDFIDGFAKMFDCPRALLRTGAKNELMEILRKCYPNIKRSRVRLFIEGAMTEEESNSLQIHHRRNRDMVLLFCDLVETMYDCQYQSRIKQQAARIDVKQRGVAVVREENNDKMAAARAGRARKKEEREAEQVRIAAQGQETDDKEIEDGRNENDCRRNSPCEHI